MLKKALGILMLVSASLYALTYGPTVLDSVKVPAKIIKGSGVNWTGKVTYFLTVGDNDSLTVTLSVVPDVSTPAAPACAVTPTDGDFGVFPMITGKNGKREIFFNATFAAAPQPTDKYVAKVTIHANMSATETLARQMLAAIPSTAEKIKMITGTGDFATNDANGGTFGTILGFHMIDGPHGVNIWRNVPTTAFPTEVSSACAFDTGLSYAIGKAIGQECHTAYLGRNVNLGPMINLVRDPRGGRDYETWGEDPYLMAKLCVSDVRGRQSENVVSTPKHFVCNDQERDRYLYTANVDTVVLRQTYCYPFEAAVRDGGCWAIMASYNKVNGVYCTENPFTETQILKQEWGFRGMVMTDWGTQMSIKGAAAGTDIEMDETTIFGGIVVGQNGVTQDILDDKILRELRVKIWTGCVSSFPHATDPSTICNADHAAISYQAEQESIVLVKNNALPINNNLPLLPINKNGTAKIAVVGPYANQCLTGPAGPVTSSYVLPCPSDLHTPLHEITAKYGASKMVSDWTQADIVIVVVSVPTTGTEAPNENYDRPDATLGMSEALTDPDTKQTIPATDQNALVSQIVSAGKKTIVVLEGGCGVVKDAWYSAPSVLVAFFGGQRIGMAVADVVFGDVNPSGRISVTFPVAQTDLPTFTNGNGYVTYEAANEGRGYPYYIAKNITPLIPFGYGLSYTTFAYSNPVIPTDAYIGDKIRVSVTVKNAGTVDGADVPQLYISQKGSPTYRPVRQLRGFARAQIAAGQSQTVNFDLREMDFAHWTQASGWIVDPESQYDILIAKNSMDANALKGTITLHSAN